jgi:class 3 adenylate cyclase
VETYSLGATFLRYLTCARYCIYVSLFALASLDLALREQSFNQGLLYLLIAPCVLHALYPRLRYRGLLLGLYQMEWLLGLVVLLLTGVSQGVLLTMVLAFLTANTALWGAGWLAVCLVSGGLVQAAFTWPVPSTGWLQLAALVWTSAMLLGICAVAHWQANQLIAAWHRAMGENRSLLRFLPRQLPTFLRAGATPRVERTWLTVMFVDLKGFTRATRTLPSEALAEVLNDSFEELTRHVEDWGGSVDKFLGDGLLCLFIPEGPDDRRNAAIQSVRCSETLADVFHALNLQWAEHGYLYRFAASVGIASGYCAMGQWGGPDRCDFTPIGETVNLAKRLQEHAHGAGDVLLDEVTVRLVEGAIGATYPVQLELNGLGPTRAACMAPLQ